MTRDRWLQMVAGVSLIALVVWIARHTYWDEITLTTPPRGEAARNPYYAMMHLAQALGIRSRMTGSLRELPPDSSLFVDSLHDDLSHEPIEFLQAWVQSGGRLIIRSDTLRASEPLQIWSGIRRFRAGSAQPVALRMIASSWRSPSAAWPTGSR
jgi:hypothetical protein